MLHLNTLLNKSQPVINRPTQFQGKVIPFEPAKTDQVQIRFGRDLFTKYGVIPDFVKVQKTKNVNLPEKINKTELILRVLQAHEHGLKNKAAGNFSGVSYSSSILLSDGSWTLGANTELTRDTLLCGERSAFINGRNRALEATPLEKINDTPVTAKVVAMSSGKDIYSPAPCSECQSWLSTDKYFGPDVVLATLKRDDKGEVTLILQTMKDLLPFNQKLQPSKGKGSLGRIPLEISDKAKAFAKENGIGKRQLRTLIAEAKQAYKKNKTANFSGKNSGASVLLSNGEITAAGRFEDTNRWVLDAADIARANAFQSLKNPDKERLMAVAYYGDGTYPNPANIGKMAQQSWGGPDTLVVLVQNNKIDIKTLNEHSTDIYISSSFAKKK